MNYSPLILFGLGLFGIVIHNLVKLNEINVKQSGNVRILEYLKLERFTIILSVCVVLVALLVKDEIMQIKQLSTWVGVSFVSIGYMAQSIIVSIMGKGQKILDNE